MPSATVEDYIKQIYLVADATGEEEVAMGRVAEALKVVPGTATTMVKALADAGLANYAPRVGVRLTPQGRALALHVLRRHRLIEQFLVDQLGFDWSEVHEEAEQLEHVISERVLERIDKLLGYPTVDPHGDPIPSASGEMLADRLETLLECPLDERVEVARISDQDPEFLLYIAKSGLNPGARVEITERNKSAEAVQLLVAGQQLSLGWGAAAKVLVQRA
jgi:DtxR family Mn-dependent transcriptional regulator